MDRNNKGMAVLIESDNNSAVGLSTLVLDDDEQSIKDMVPSFENCCHSCKVISEDDEVGTIRRSLDGSCVSLVKPIPLRDLNRKNDLSQVVQQQPNNVSRAEKTRMSWTPLMREKFLESVQELGSIEKATPMKILERLKIKGFEHLTREQVSSHRQKYRLKLQKDKDGTSSEHVHEMEEYPTETLSNLLFHAEANPCTIDGQPSGEDFPPLQDDFFDGLPNYDTRVQQQTNKEARKRMKWTTELENIFQKALKKLNNDKAQPMEILKFMKDSRVAPKDLTIKHVASHLQKIRLKIERKKDPSCKITNSKYHQGLSSTPQQLATAAGNMCLQPNVGTQVLQNKRLPLSSGTIEGTIMQDQALVANVAGMFNNTSLPSSSQYKVVDANETAMPGNGSNYFTRLEYSLDDDILNSLLSGFCSSSQDCGNNLEVLLGADGSLPSSSQDQFVST